jgi:cell division protein FtsQ
MEEAEGLPVITGLERSQYVDQRAASEAALREALALVAAWRSNPQRPALSEVSVEPRYGYALFLLEGGAEIRLGRGEYDRKLASLDQIFEAVKADGARPRDFKVVHLDGPNRNQIHVLFAAATARGAPTRNDRPPQ